MTREHVQLVIIRPNREGAQTYLAVSLMLHNMDTGVVTDEIGSSIGSLLACTEVTNM